MPTQNLFQLNFQSRIFQLIARKYKILKIEKIRNQYLYIMDIFCISFKSFNLQLREQFIAAMKSNIECIDGPLTARVMTFGFKLEASKPLIT